MKKYVLIIVCLFSLHTFSQTLTRDVVYLKNGSVIKGQIKEMNPSENLKIETSDGSLFVYKMTEIEKMEKEVLQSKPILNNSSNNNKLSRSIATRSIKNVFKYPKDQLLPIKVNWNGAGWTFAKRTNSILVNAGYLMDNNPTGSFGHYFATLTQKGENYRRSKNYKSYSVGTIDMKVSEYEFVEITGVLQSPNSNRAKVNYTVRRKQLTELGRLFLNKGSKEGRKYLVEGEIINKEVHFIKYDDGWRIIENDELNEMARYINLSKEKFERIESRKKEFSKAGDWKESDLAEHRFRPFFLKAENVPLFEEATTLFSVRKNDKTCNDCRNDNLMAIESTIKGALLETNRYDSASSKDYKKSVNNGSAFFYINGIYFNHLGIDKGGKDKGFSCGISYGIFIKGNYTSPTISSINTSQQSKASTSVWWYYPNKESAFKGALSVLDKQVKKIVYSGERLAINVLSIEVDKRGNPSYVILETVNNLFDLNKIKFNIYKKSTLSAPNGKLQLGDGFGELVYDKDDFPKIIKCKIRKGKTKKILKKYIGKESELIGINK